MTAIPDQRNGENGELQRRDELLTLDTDEVFYLLGNDRRRSIVHALVADDEPRDVSDLANDIAGDDDGSYKSVYVSLQQSHLQQLDEHGVIDYDSEERTVERGPRFDELASYVEPAEEPDHDWRPYLVGGVVGLVLTGASAFVTAVGPLVTGTLACVSAVSLLAYAAYERASET
jgi:hypothetical protein